MRAGHDTYKIRGEDGFAKKRQRAGDGPRPGGRGTLDRLCAEGRAPRQGLAPGPVLVHRQFCAHDNGDRFCRAVDGSWRRLERARGRAGRRFRHLLHGVSCQPGAAAGPAADDSVAGPVRLARGDPAVRRDRVRLLRLQRIQRHSGHRSIANRAARRAAVLVSVFGAAGDRHRGRRPRSAAFRTALADADPDRRVRGADHRRIDDARGRGYARSGRRLGRVSRAVFGRGRLPDQLCRVCFGLFALSTAQRLVAGRDFLDLFGRGWLRDLAHVAGRVSGRGAAASGSHRQLADGRQRVAAGLRHRR